MNFSINGKKINTSEEYRSPNLICAGATDEDLEWFEKFSYWIEGIFQLGLGKLMYLNILLKLSFSSWSAGLKIFKFYSKLRKHWVFG